MVHAVAKAAKNYEINFCKSQNNSTKYSIHLVKDTPMKKLQTRVIGYCGWYRTSNCDLIISQMLKKAVRSLFLFGIRIRWGLIHISDIVIYFALMNVNHNFSGLYGHLETNTTLHQMVEFYTKWRRLLLKKTSAWQPCMPLLWYILW